MDTAVVRLGSSLLLLFFAVGALLALLRCAVGLLHLKLSALLAVVGALVVELLVLGCDLLASCFAVTAAASTDMLLASVDIYRPIRKGLVLVWLTSTQR